MRAAERLDDDVDESEGLVEALKVIVGVKEALPERVGAAVIDSDALPLSDSVAVIVCDADNDGTALGLEERDGVEGRPELEGDEVAVREPDGVGVIDGELEEP